MSTHCRKHGEDVLNQLILKDCYNIEKKKAAATAPKELYASSLQFIKTCFGNPEEAKQVVRVNEVMLTEDNSSWRSGMNIELDGHDLEPLMGALVEQELEARGLYLQTDQSDKTLGLYAGKSFGEGEVVVDFSAAMFTKMDKLNQFLSSKGNRLLAACMVRQESILLDSESDKPTSVFGVGMGAARFLRHYLSRRRGPNCEIRCYPSVGATDGFHELSIAPLLP